MRPERRVMQGIGASPGVAVGSAALLDAGLSQVPRRHIEAHEVDAQIERLSRALEGSRLELETVRDRLGDGAAADYRLILDAYLMMHGDDLLTSSATRHIRERSVNAEWAVEQTILEISEHLAAAPDSYLRDRASDIDHVGRRIIAQLVGRSTPLPPADGDHILVVDDLHPADAVRLIETPVRALVTGLGSATSHTAILARTLDIPAVVGVSGVTRRVGAGDRLIVDALRGCVVLHPEPGEAERAEQRGRRYFTFTRKLREESGTHSETSDGVAIGLQANVDLPAEAAIAVDQELAGIGLYRTEFLFMNRAVEPDEAEQAAVYSDIVRVMAPRPVTLRTIDVGGDRLTIDGARPVVPNPALGLRAIRLSLSRPELFHVQLCAILRAAVHGAVRIMFPLVSGLGELRRARRAVEQARADLKQRGVAFGDAKVGVMIELPSAVVMADKLAAECDFFSVGTNDLVQYVLAADRTNPEVAYLAESLDPAVLRMLHTVVMAAQAHGLPLSMCGDMAADALALPLVLGLGFRELSVPLSSLPLVRGVIRRIDVAQARRVADEALQCDTSRDVQALVCQQFSGTLGEVWDEAGIGQVS